MGRKFLPIEPYIEKLEQAILLGATYELAALYAGISESTFQRWRAKAAQAPDGSPLAVLRERLRQAEGRAAIGWLAKIEQAAQAGDWRAAAFKLERRWPEAYGRSFQKVAPVSADGAPLQGEGLASLLAAAVIALPSKSPSPEQWQQDVARLGYHPHPNGTPPPAAPEPRP
jgi:hypothetical protein